jgi:pilus assembly protein CpaB
VPAPSVAGMTELTASPRTSAPAASPGPAPTGRAAPRRTAVWHRGRPPGRLGWRRGLLLRRALAAALAGLALVLALAPADRAAVVPVVVAAADLPAGAALRAADLTVREWPADLAPGGALRAVPDADGRSLVGAARAGEPITDARLVAAPGHGGVGPDGAVVAVRLADAGVAAVLTPGSRVDVVAAGERADQPVVLTADATVQAVLGPDQRAGPGSGIGSGAASSGPGERLVLIGMPRAAASRVAAVSLTRPVAVTLR